MASKTLVEIPALTYTGRAVERLYSKPVPVAVLASRYMGTPEATYPSMTIMFAGPE